MNGLAHALFFVMTFGMVFVGLMLLEAWYWYRKGRTDVYSLKESLAGVATGFCYKMVDGAAIVLFIQYFYEFVYDIGLQFSPEASVASFLLLFLVTDLAFWFMHMTTHKVRWFWATHVTHHSGEHMNFSTALRQNALGLFNFTWMLWWTPLALVGFQKEWVMVAIELNLVYQFFLHTEAVDDLGWFGKIFNTPSHHRVHHGSGPKQIDTNFGGVLILWDKLFGTFVAEKDAGDIVYGVTRQPESYNPFWLQVHEFVDMMRDLVRYRDLRILIKHPDWTSEHYGQQSNLMTTAGKQAKDLNATIESAITSS